MKLQTKLNLRRLDGQCQINYNSQLLLLGSCFAENIADKLNYFQFQNISNPLGILFHSKAIENLIRKSVEGFEYSEASVFFHNEQWHSFEAHSKLSSLSKVELISRLNDAVVVTNNQLKKATHVVVTLGTAWLYEFIETNKCVANCHKVSQKQFRKKILSVNEIIESLESIIHLIKEVNKKASIIFTVSPVRHLKDGFVENQRSKAHLISAIHDVIQNTNQLGVYYFESYEIVLDELRDYRFYKEDMLHPNELAIEYIWEKFCSVWVSPHVQTTMKKVEIIQNGLRHVPFNAKSIAHQEFERGIADKIENLQLEYSHFLFKKYR